MTAGTCWNISETVCSGFCLFVYFWFVCLFVCFVVVVVVVVVFCFVFCFLTGENVDVFYHNKRKERIKEKNRRRKGIVIPGIFLNISKRECIYAFDTWKF